MDDRPHASCGREERGWIRDVAADELALDAVERSRAVGRSHHRADAHAALRQVARHVPPDEPARARDEDHPSSVKFCQYRLGVGPRCPWYFEPSEPEP